MMNMGCRMEQMVLYLCSKGYGTCFLASTRISHSLQTKGNMVLAGLIAFGIWALYDILISDWLTTALTHYFGYGIVYDFIHGLPNIIVGILLVFAGIKLLGLHPAKKDTSAEDDVLPPYPGEEK